MGKAQDSAALGRLANLFRPVIARYTDLTEDERYTARDYIRKFNGAYSYVTQLVRLHDRELFSEYQYTLHLIRLLPRAGSGEFVDIDDKIKLEYASLKETFSGAIVLDEKPPIFVPGGGLTPKVLNKKKDTLQSIIDKVNECFNGNFTDKHRLADNEESEKNIQLVWNAETQTWNLAEGQDAVVVFKVTCAPEGPKMKDLRQVQVKVQCVNDNHDEADKNSRTYRLVDEDGVSQVTFDKEKSAWTCQSKVYSVGFVKRANEVTKGKEVPFTDAHKVCEGEKNKFQLVNFTLENGKWVTDTKEIIFDVNCEPKVIEEVVPEGFTVRCEADGSLIKEEVIDSWNFYTQIDIPNVNGEDSEVTEWAADCIDLVVKPGDYLSGQTLDLDFTWNETHPTIVFTPLFMED